MKDKEVFLENVSLAFKQTVKNIVYGDTNEQKGEGSVRLWQQSMKANEKERSLYLKKKKNLQVHRRLSKSSPLEMMHKVNTGENIAKMRREPKKYTMHQMDG